MVEEEAKNLRIKNTYLEQEINKVNFRYDELKALQNDLES